MSSRSSYNTNRYRNRGENNELIPVRNGIFYGIETVMVDEQKNTLKREILTIPNVTFYSNYTKMMIDFSDYQNNPDKNKIDNFFALMKYGETFTINNASWKNIDISENTYDLSGTFIFEKIVDDIIFGSVTSVSSYSTKINRYDKEYFRELPYIEISTTTKKNEINKKTRILNHLGKSSKNSFSYLGIRIGDYIELYENKKKYLVESYAEDVEGKEIVVVAGEMIEENKVGTPVLVVLHQQNINKNNLNYDNKILGKCEIVVNGSIVECINNHTELQAKLRENKTQNLTTTFTASEYCDIAIPQQDIVDVTSAITAISTQIARTNVIRESIQTTKLSTIDTSLMSRINLLNNL